MTNCSAERYLQAHGVIITIRNQCTRRISTPDPRINDRTLHLDLASKVHPVILSSECVGIREQFAWLPASVQNSSTAPEPHVDHDFSQAKTHPLNLVSDFQSFVIFAVG